MHVSQYEFRFFQKNLGVRRDRAGEPYVTCGPFEFTSFSAGDFYEISANPDFHYYPDFPPETDTTTTTTGPGFDPTLAIVAGAVGAAVVILVGGFVLLRQK